MRKPVRWAGVAALGLALGCQAQPLILRDAKQGMQWHWPHFLDGNPTALVFWTTESMECLRAIPSLNTLSMMNSPVEMVSVATGPDRMRIDNWIRGQYETPIRFTVLVDQEEKLAKKLKVDHYPTYILFGVSGEEVERVYDVKLAYQWFRYERYWDKAGVNGQGN